MIKELISLLEWRPERANVSQCLAAINGSEELRYRNGDDQNKTLPLAHVIDINRVRSKFNTEINNGIIVGYEELLSALENATVEVVRIISLELLDKWYVIFTDKDISELFGILDCPKKKAAWFSKETGYN